MAYIPLSQQTEIKPDIQTGGYVPLAQMTEESRQGVSKFSERRVLLEDIERYSAESEKARKKTENIFLRAGAYLQSLPKAIYKKPLEVGKGILETGLLEPLEAISRTTLFKQPLGITGIGIPGVKLPELKIPEFKPPETEEAKKARQVGEFAGYIAPYAAGAKLASGMLKATNLYTKLGKYAPYVSEAAGFVGTGQILHKPEEGSRAKRAATELAILPIFWGLGFVGKKIAPPVMRMVDKAITPVLEKLKLKQKVPLAEVETAVKEAETVVKEATGKKPSELIIEEANKPPKIQREPIISETKLAKGDIVSEPNVGRFIVSDVKTKIVPEGKIQNVSLKDLEGNIYEQDIKDLTGFLRETKLPLSEIGRPTEIPPTEMIRPIVGREGQAIQLEPQRISIPRAEAPVGAGKEKVSRLAARMSEKLEALTPEGRAEILTYQQVNKKENIEAAIKYVLEKPEEAMAVIKGKKAPPQGILYNSIALAMDSFAKDTADAKLALELASLRATRAGQEISILTEADPRNPVTYLVRLAKDKIEALGGKERLTTIIKRETANLKNELRKVAPNKSDWAAFIKSIECK